MFQKGPGEGFQAAKEAVLALEPTASCRISYDGGTRHFRIFVSDRDVGCGAMSSRGAWNKYLERLEGRVPAPRPIKP